MNMCTDLTHLLGELVTDANRDDNSPIEVETFGGKIYVEWDPQSTVTTLGQLSFFIEFLKLGGLFDRFVEHCPLTYGSGNAPAKRDVLGTILLSILSGYTRYSHISRLQCDQVNPPLLGMTKVVSEDAVRRALQKLDEVDSMAWLQGELYHCYKPLLAERWILDVDTTIKTIYGKQEGAKVGYNPHKPGRPSHTYHSYMLADVRIMLGVEVQPGNANAASDTAPGLWEFIDRLPKEERPEFVRGDASFGIESIIRAAEERNVDYLFKLKKTKNIKRLIDKLMRGVKWVYAGQGWEGAEAPLQLQGWSRARRVIILRRAVHKSLGVLRQDKESQQREFVFADVDDDVTIYEYTALVTSLPNEILSIAQYYRDRADSENSFDELKNQWGWCGFTTHDMKRCRIMAILTALIFNWWSLFVRLADPMAHREAITSRPLLLEGVGKEVNHARQKRVVMTNHHRDGGKVRKILRAISIFFKRVKHFTEQLDAVARWYVILSRALVKYLKGRLLKPPDRLPCPV